MTPYRSTPPTDDDEIIFKPRSRWPLRMGVAFMWAFLAFVYYAFFSAFGRDGAVAIPAPFLITLLMTVRILRTGDQNRQ